MKKIDFERRDIIFSLTDVKGGSVEVMRISQGKFFWKGKEIKDIKKIYGRFHEWLKQTEKKELITQK